MSALIELKDVYKIYKMGEESVHAADGISLTIDAGEFVAIVGQSGSGKSTCMNIIGCLDVPTSGSYFLNGQDVSHMKDDQLAEVRNKMLGFIFQQYNLIPKLNVQENVELSLLYAGVGAKKRSEMAREALERVGLAGKMKNLPSPTPTSRPARSLPPRAARCWIFSKSSMKRATPSSSSRTTTPSPWRRSVSCASLTAGSLKISPPRRKRGRSPWVSNSPFFWR